MAEINKKVNKKATPFFLHITYHDYPLTDHPAPGSGGTIYASVMKNSAPHFYPHTYNGFAPVLPANNSSESRSHVIFYGN